jgi:hypothetical protein
MSTLSRHWCAGALSLAALACATQAQAGQTRGYVVSWFYPSAYSQEGDCPDGLNWSTEQDFRRILAEQGKSPAEIDAIVATPGAAFAFMPNRGRIDGKPANIYLNPASLPDPGGKVMRGKVSFGFNLDGKVGPEDFTDPQTGEQGVDNQLFRALGCFTPNRATPPDRPSHEGGDWDTVRDAMPAWLVEISGIDDVRNDDDVEVAILQAREPITRSANGGDPEHGMTFTVDPSPRHQNRVQGRIKDGVLTTGPFDVNMMADPVNVPEYHFKQARLRLKFTADGGLNGILGGYHDWKEIYWGKMAPGIFVETVISLDAGAVYHLLKKQADALPDPKTGENTAISATYGIEAVPAFIIHGDKTAAAR